MGAYWITTAEELWGAAVQDGGLAGLGAVTGLPQDEVIKLVALAQGALPQEASFAPSFSQPHGMGALDEPEGDNPDAGRASFAPLPPGVDLHDRFGAVRDQGQRGTCVAHACAAVREFLAGQQSAQSNFSEQFLYWDCKKHDMVPGEGTFVRVGMNRLEIDGIPAESDWPYNPTPIPGNEGQGPEPAGIMEKANPNRITSSSGLSATNVDGLRQTLVNGTPVAFSVPVYTHWFSEPTHSSGDIRMPLPGEKVEGGHAMCMVGYETDPNVPGGGYFMVRNSWGTGWGRESAVAPGYARIPFAFINQYGKTAYIGAGPIPPKPKSTWQRFLAWLRDLFG
ncbi:MAG: C1 family peptidase [Anaerolineales bacterium]|nr:C1 family peptidase [Anaerolineales bacterium]